MSLMLSLFEFIFEFFRNISVIEQHFEWVREANIGVVAVSWYPPGKVIDRLEE